jgi:hypothetical protein
VNDPENDSFQGLYQRLLEAAKEAARRNRERLDKLRRQYDLPDEAINGLDWEADAPADD